jgi:hypothetical protein
MSGVRRQENGSNEELVAKLQSEISMEEDMKEDEDLSANIKEYLENSPFEVRSLYSLRIRRRTLTILRSKTRPAARKSSSHASTATRRSGSPSPLPT